MTKSSKDVTLPTAKLITLSLGEVSPKRGLLSSPLVPYVRVVKSSITSPTPLLSSGLGVPVCSSTHSLPQEQKFSTQSHPLFLTGLQPMAQGRPSIRPRVGFVYATAMSPVASRGYTQLVAQREGFKALLHASAFSLMISSFPTGPEGGSKKAKLIKTTTATSCHPTG